MRILSMVLLVVFCFSVCNPIVFAITDGSNMSSQMVSDEQVSGEKNMEKISISSQDTGFCGKVLMAAMLAVAIPWAIGELLVEKFAEYAII